VTDYDTSNARARLLTAWANWDHAPGDAARVREFEDAMVDYAGNQSLACRRFIVERLRHGHTRAEAIDMWETDW
jgi:hypothetical protein